MKIVITNLHLQVITHAWPSIIEYFCSFAEKYGANLIVEREFYIDYKLYMLHIQRVVTNTEESCNFTARVEIDWHGGNQVAIQSIFGTVWQISIKGDFYITSGYNNDKLAPPFRLSAGDNLTINFEFGDDIMRREMGESYDEYTQHIAKSLLDELVRDAEKKINEIL